ncbi:hypothetical protein E2562_000141, partial [Oryza meyeriana var. granulata]
HQREERRNMRYTILALVSWLMVLALFITTTIASASSYMPVLLAGAASKGDL